MDTDDGLAWLERRVQAAVEGHEAGALCKLSIAVGVTELATTAKTGRHIPKASTLAGKADAGAAAFAAHAQELASPALAAAAAAPDATSAARAAVKVIIGDLLSCAATGAAMPRDALHGQHLSSWAEWRLAGAQKRGLKLDCAGLTFAVYALAQELAERVPALAGVAMAVAEDHCWISVDGSAVRTAAAEVACEDPAQRGEPPGEGPWNCFLYSAGHATVCTRAQAVAAVIGSMDTCVGDKRSEESDVARAVQLALFEALVATGGASALYPNARCTLAEVRQDGILDAAREAAPQGQDAVRAELQALREPFLEMLAVAGTAEGVDSGGSACLAAADDAAHPAAVSSGAEQMDDGARGADSAPASHLHAEGTAAHAVSTASGSIIKLDPPDCTGTNGAAGSSSNVAMNGSATSVQAAATIAASTNGQASCPSVDATGAATPAQAAAAQAETSACSESWPNLQIVRCPLTVGDVRLPRRVDGQWRWYPSWFAAMYLWDTAEVLYEELSVALGEAAVAAEVQALAVLALRVMAIGPLARYRFHKYDEQLCKTLEQLSDSALDFFQWQATRAELPEPLRFAAFHAYVAFVDRLACYYAPVGIPGKLIAAVLKICRLQSADVRHQAAAEQAWEAANLRGSAAVWRDLKPALRVMLESAWASNATAAVEAGGPRGRARKRVKR